MSDYEIPILVHNTGLSVIGIIKKEDFEKANLDKIISFIPTPEYCSELFANDDDNQGIHCDIVTPVFKNEIYRPDWCYDLRFIGRAHQILEALASGTYGFEYWSKSNKSYPLHIASNQASCEFVVVVAPREKE